ncbi:branched-chain amino acid aminotransferase [Woeseia oceani]|uniref:Branched-chain-amino-acid aminotransferase n=2 Tax=Woeseia oceani TaxID=1548547 RepID=A0A193LG43_9GAMM|nr:branched-chain amino acid transaminase [Woeseia oceani]ANO51431.1 branched-chain amino acid aminotransferase [Woeseia oceani]
MSFDGAKHIWMNGQMMPWEKANVHVMAHALHYGSSVFEGIRMYATPDGPKVFRLKDHMRRLYDSAKIYRMPIPQSIEELSSACKQVCVINELTDGAYIRPIAFRGYGEIGLAPKAEHPVDVAIGAWKWGAYLGADGLEKGVDVCVSSWQRVAPNTIPALAKSGGNYLSSQLISTEAKRLGFAEGIALSTDGTVSEGAGENLFVIRDGVLLTPPSAASILTGITRDSIIKIATDLGMTVREQSIPREALYLADEMFFTGTAAEITPIRSVDRIQIGAGKRGPLTAQLQEAFFGLFSGATKDTYGWLEGLDEESIAVASAS